MFFLILLINELSYNKNGLFYSDDEGDVKNNPDKEEPEKILEQPANVNVLVKTAHVSIPVSAPEVETKSKDYSSQKAFAF